MRRRLATLLVAVFVLAACGNKDDGGAIAAGPTTSAPAVDVALVIDVKDATGGARNGSVTCRGSIASGTGMFLDGATAAGVCAAVLHDDEAKRRLTQGPATGVACTQQYGGPATAHVTGTFSGMAVDTTFSRTDGCAIGDWDHLVTLLGPA